MDHSLRDEKGTRFTKLRDPDKDLMIISSQIEVLKLGSCDLVKELIGDISSDDEEVDDRCFEQYLVSDIQGMARTKMPGRKTNDPPNPFTPLSPGGLPLANKSPSRAKPPAKNPQNKPLKGGQLSRSSPRKQHLLPNLGSDDNTSEGSSCLKRSRRDQSKGELSSPNCPVAGKSSKQHRQSRAPWKQAPPWKPDSKKMMKELCTKRNSSAIRVGKVSETQRCWLKKAEHKRDAQNKLLRRLRLGLRALQEIRHYQHCQTFLIAMGPFQHLVHEICESLDV